MSIVQNGGYLLKKYSLKKWIYENGHTQPFVARKLGIDPEEFKRMLREHEKFNEEQITKLVELMKAEAAFKVIFFPTKEQRQQVWQDTFGKTKGGSK